MAATPLRSVRVASSIWDNATTRAAENDETVTDVIVRALSAYARVNEDGTTMPAPRYLDTLHLLAQRLDAATNGRLTPVVLDTAGCVIVGTSSGHLAIDGLHGSSRTDAFDVGVYEDGREDAVSIEECYGLDETIRYVRDQTGL